MQGVRVVGKIASVRASEGISRLTSREREGRSSPCDAGTQGWMWIVCKGDALSEGRHGGLAAGNCKARRKADLEQCPLGTVHLKHADCACGSSRTKSLNSTSSIDAGPFWAVAFWETHGSHRPCPPTPSSVTRTFRSTARPPTSSSSPESKHRVPHNIAHRAGSAASSPSAMPGLHSSSAHIAPLAIANAPLVFIATGIPVHLPRNR